MKYIILVFILLSNIATAKSIVYQDDHGRLLLPNKFSTSCIINDPGISGSSIINAYSNGQVNCSEIQELYSDIYTHAREYLTVVRKYDFTKVLPSNTLSLRILTLAELNNPDNFSQTDDKCMYNAMCNSGAYFGRIFYPESSSNINVYVVYHSGKVPNSRYSFISNIKHELMHAILYRYRWNYILSDSEEHALIDDFLRWNKKK